MKVLLQGDTHGELVPTEMALKNAVQQGADLVIQLGDFGYGWRRDRDGEDWFSRKVSELAVEYHRPVWWIDGNHENFDLLEARGLLGADEPVEMMENLFYVPRGTLLPVGDARCLFVGGAYSVDKHYRTAHVDWWPQEELTYEQVMRATSYEDLKVDVVFSHDVCDTGFSAALALAVDADLSGDWRQSNEMHHLYMKNDEMFPHARPNRMALEAVFDAHHPADWYHGHYHSAYDAEVDGTRFHGLAHEHHNGAQRIIEL